MCQQIISKTAQGFWQAQHQKGTEGSEGGARPHGHSANSRGVRCSRPVQAGQVRPWWVSVKHTDKKPVFRECLFLRQIWLKGSPQFRGLLRLLKNRRSLKPCPCPLTAASPQRSPSRAPAASSHRGPPLKAAHLARRLWMLKAGIHLRTRLSEPNDV